jgi:hypothetical protein
VLMLSHDEIVAGLVLGSSGIVANPSGYFYKSAFHPGDRFSFLQEKFGKRKLRRV